MSDIEVAGLYTYPIKSCAGVALEAATVTAFGLEHDRDFMIVGEDGTYISQRQVPELALVRPTLTKSTLRVDAPGMETMAVMLGGRLDDAEPVLANVHGEPVWGQTVNRDVDAWFEAALPMHAKAKSYRLLRILHNRPRLIDLDYQKPDASNRSGFADEFPLLIASTQSLAALNEVIRAGGHDAVAMSRFRPNVVVDGEDLDAYDEDMWRKIKIGDFVAYVVKPCKRCVMTDTEVSHDEKFDKVTIGSSVRVALSKSRKGRNIYDGKTGTFFGQNLNQVFTPGQELAVGQTVTILDRSDEPNVEL